MGWKRIVGIIIILCGFGLIGLSMYITEEVQKGKVQVSEAQRKVDRGTGLFSLSPITEEIGKGITGDAQSKINEGIRMIGEYEDVARWSMIGGIACLVLGTGVVIFGGRRKK
jgi:hypothetical protein